MSSIQDSIESLGHSIQGLEGDRQKLDAKIERLDKAIASLMEERQKMLDDLNNPVRIRVQEIYIEVARLFEELRELGDEPFHEEEAYVGYDEHEMRSYPVQFEGQYYSYYDGKIETK